MQRMLHRRGDAVVGHIADNGQRIDLAGRNPAGKISAAECAWQGLLHVMVTRTTSDDFVQVPSMRTLALLLYAKLVRDGAFDQTKYTGSAGGLLPET